MHTHTHIYSRSLLLRFCAFDHVGSCSSHRSYYAVERWRWWATTRTELRKMRKIRPSRNRARVAEDVWARRAGRHRARPASAESESLAPVTWATLATWATWATSDRAATRWRRATRTWSTGSRRCWRAESERWATCDCCCCCRRRPRSAAAASSCRCWTTSSDSDRLRPRHHFRS